MEIPEEMLLLIDRCSVSKTSRQSLHFVFPLAPPPQKVHLADQSASCKLESFDSFCISFPKLCVNS